MKHIISDLNRKIGVLEGEIVRYEYTISQHKLAIETRQQQVNELKEAVRLLDLAQLQPEAFKCSK